MAAQINTNEDMISAINVVPLVDIVLVLLIVFMVTANFMVKPAIDMDLPKADTGEAKERNQFSLLLGKDGSIAIGEKAVEEANVYDEFLLKFAEYKDEKRKSAEAEGRDLSDNRAELLARNELTMLIQADTLVPHGRVIHFIDQARKAGISKYAFNVDSEAVAGASAAAIEDSERQPDKKSATSPTLNPKS